MRSVKPGLIAAGVGLGVNAALATVKILAGVAGNSYALIADGLESIADIVGSLVVWTGLRISAIPADEDHPYGHGKAESIAGLVVALALLAAAAFIAMQSIREIITPHHAPAAFTLAVLGLVIVTKWSLSRYVFKIGHELTSTAVKGDAWHHRSDAITSAAAFVGISIALAGGEGYESSDDWAALLACSVIAYNGVRLFRTALHEIMDGVVPPDVRARVLRESADVDGVLGVDECRIRKSGVNMFVDLQVRVDGSITVWHGNEIAEQVKARLKGGIPGIAEVMVHIEPGHVPASIE